MVKSGLLAGVLLSLVLAACSPGNAPSAAAPSPSAAPARPQNPLVIGVRLEPANLAQRPPVEPFANTDHTRLFNADIAILDDKAVPRPYLVAALPELNTESWQVAADGSMQTTYHLRPNLTWHDGTPLNADDFVFAWQVYTSPGFAQAKQPPFSAIDTVEAPDPQTVRIHWTRLYPDAAHMTGRDQDLPPLPKHLLATDFANDTPETFVSLPYWTRDYVGLGPFRLTAWEPGSHIEGVAFDGHALGRPKIDRIELRFTTDPNVVLANMVSGEMLFASGSSLGIQQGVSLSQQWGPQGGTVFYPPSAYRGADFQFRPEYANPPALQDVRVRRAMISAIDRDALNEAINSGHAMVANYYLPPVGEWGAAIQRGAIVYAHDPSKAEQLMTDAGFTRGADGIYASPSGGRLEVEIRTTGSADVLAAAANDWEKAGIAIDQKIVPPQQAQDRSLRGSFPGIFLQINEVLIGTALAPIPGNVSTAQNNWSGSNRSGWTNPDYTRLVEKFTATLDHDQRADQLAQMAHIWTDDVAAVPIDFPPQVWATPAAVVGPKDVPPPVNDYWNVQDWTFPVRR
jgi:peptide/nickel transport system substrate-binding protein